MGNNMCPCGQPQNQDSVKQSAFWSIDLIQKLPENVEILDVIGTRQYGEVKRALSPEHGSVAIKCIELSRINQEKRVIGRELNILSSISHENIVRYLGCYKDDEFFYMMMELCEGGNLRESIDALGTIAEMDMKQVAREVLVALAHLHSAGIAHRDIKPENILFTTNRHVKLADFGLSRKLFQAKVLTVVGTPYYISPEMLNAKYTSKCDLWSFGIVMYFALTGLIPFNAEDLPGLFNVIRTTEIAEWKELSPLAVDFVKMLTRKSPKERLSAAEALQHPWLAEPAA